MKNAQFLKNWCCSLGIGTQIWNFISTIFQHSDLYFCTHSYFRVLIIVISDLKHAMCKCQINTKVNLSFKVNINSKFLVICIQKLKLMYRHVLL